MKSPAPRLLSRFVLIATLVASAMAAEEESARFAAHRGKTVVLVHGAFADGSSWSEVVRLLQRRGLAVVSVQNPLTSLSADSAAVHRAINQQRGQVVLAGHSWGGAVITEAGTNPKVAALVYVAAFAPDTGESISTLLQGHPPAPWLSELRQDEGGHLTLSFLGISGFFAHDLPPVEARVVAAVQGPWFAGCLVDKVTQAAWRSRPSHWILPSDDRMIPPPLQHAMAARMNASVTVLRGSHAVMMSHPHKVAEVIAEVAVTEQ